MFINLHTKFSIKIICLWFLFFLSEQTYYLYLYKFIYQLFINSRTKFEQIGIYIYVIPKTDNVKSPG